MGWRDTVTPASLDGVDFLFKTLATKIGRRTVLHEFPNRDEPFAEDLGRKAREYKIQAFIIGDNYPAERDRLMSVIEAGGDHTFSHAYLGSFTVKILGEVDVTESDEEGGMVRFDGLTLVESGLAFPLVQFDTVARIQYIADDVDTKLAEKTKLSVLGAIGAVLKSIANGLGVATSAMRKVNGQISAGLGTIDNITNAINEFEKEMLVLLGTPQRLVNKLTALVRAAINLVKDFFPKNGGVDILDPVIDELGIVLSAFETLFHFVTTGDAIPTPTDQSDKETGGHKAITDSVKTAAVTAVATVVVGLEVESADKALEIKQSFADKIDELLATDMDPAILEALATLKAALVKYFSTLAAQLPRVSRHTPNYTAPALVLASNVYGSGEFAEDLITRNRVRHPAFVPAGIEIEVLVPG